MGLFSLSEITVPGFYPCDQRDTMEEIQKEVVRLCNGYPEGLPIQEIHGLYQRTYGKPLRLGTQWRTQGGGAGATAPPRGSMVEKAR